MLTPKDFPKKICPFCHKKMSLNLNMNVLVEFEPPDRIISSAGIPLVAYICPACGFVACFNSDVMKKVMVKVP